MQDTASYFAVINTLYILVHSHFPQLTLTLMNTSALWLSEAGQDLLCLLYLIGSLTQLSIGLVSVLCVCVCVCIYIEKDPVSNIAGGTTYLAM